MDGGGYTDPSVDADPNADTNVDANGDGDDWLDESFIALGRRDTTTRNPKDTKKPKRLARESPQAQGILARPAPSRPKFGGFQTITYRTTHGATAPTKSWILNFV